MSKIPNELLHHIIAYLTKDHYEPLMKFRTVCREWKDVGDHSIVWLKCRTMMIRPPTHFVQIFRPLHSWESTFYLDEEITVIRSNSPFTRILNEVISSPLHSQVEKPHEKAFTISTAFLKKYRLCHREWRRFISFYQYFAVFEKIKFNAPVVIFILSFNTILLAAAAFLISSIPNYPTSLTLKEKLAFVCIYWNLGSSLIVFLLFFLGRFAEDLRYEDVMNVLRPNPILLHQRYADPYVVMLGLVSLFSSFALLQCSLLSLEGVKYCYIILPVFCAIVVAILIMITMQPSETSRKVGFLFFLIPVCLSILLVGLYQDLPSHGGITSLGWALVPLFPAALLLLGASAYNILKTIKLWKEWLRGEQIVELQHHSNFGVCARLVVDFLVTGSAVSVCIIVLNLIYEAFVGNLSLSTSLVSTICLLLLLEVLPVAFKYDNRYLL